MFWDTHMHTDFSGDSTAKPEEMVEKAIALGLPGICITDHEDLDYPYDDVNFDLDLDAYHEKISELQRLYQDRLPIRYGIELGLQPQLAEAHKQIVRRYPFDFVIGSSHLVHGKDPYYPDFYQDRSEQKAYTEYFSSVLENIRCFEDFDVYGHLDYVVRYGPNQDQFYSYDTYRELIDPILRTLIEKGRGLEVNTAGWKYGLSQPNPCREILIRYRELGGEILTVGADGHQPEHIAWEFPRLRDFLLAAGFRYYTVFKARKPEFLPIQ